MALHLFLDFDGTISTRDVGDEFFRTFGQFEPIHSELLNGKLSVAEYYRRSVFLLRNDCTPASVSQFVASQEVDAGFVALVQWCQRNNITVTIVSDGFDVYIEPMLARCDLSHIDRATNILEWDGATYTPRFPGASESCTCFCASCKRNEVVTRLGEGDIAVYIGDGRSDSCAAEFADVVFAKSTLASDCTRKGIPHHPYRNLSEVMIILQGKLVEGALRPRRQAVLARMRAIQAE